MYRRPQLAFAALSLAMSACGMIAGVDGDYHEVEAATCETFGRTCVAGAPDGFQGPIALHESEDGQCPAEFPTPVEENGGVFAGFHASEPSCVCECEPAENPCSDATVTTQPDCKSAAEDTTVVSANTCAELGIAAGTVVRSVFSSCKPKPSVSIPKETWDKRARGCMAPVVEATCGAGSVCLPPPVAGDRICVYQGGDASCPAAYPEKAQYYLGVALPCQTCTCGKASCDDEFQFFSDTGCPGEPLLSQQESKCGPTQQSLGSARYVVGPNATGECAPKNVVATGEAKPTGLITLCCVPAS